MHVCFVLKRPDPGAVIRRCRLVATRSICLGDWAGASVVVERGVLEQLLLELGKHRRQRSVRFVSLA